jgi:hypothetical protein
MRILIIGRARGVWEEVRRAQALCEFDQTIVINSAGCDYPHVIDHWVSFHAHEFAKWSELRRKRGYPDLRGQYWCSRSSPRWEDKYTDLVSKVECRGGSSGMVAVRVAFVVDGLNNKSYPSGMRIVLAGVPLDVEAGHYDQDGEWREALLHRKIWEEQADDMRPYVKGMSGWTQQLLGAPTREWLNGL